MGYVDDGDALRTALVSWSTVMTLWSLCRCVAEKDKPVAMGLGITLMSLFAFMPSPIFFGYLMGTFGCRGAPRDAWRVGSPSDWRHPCATGLHNLQALRPREQK